MNNDHLPLCDGCGQAASAEHIARRLKRLEWTSRYRPVHIQTLLLGAVSPEADSAFFYSPGTEFIGEAGAMLRVAGLSLAGKTAEALGAEFQRGGFFLAHVLECPLEQGVDGDASIRELLAKRSPAVAVRIRRSLKPKRVALFSQRLDALAIQWAAGDVGFPVLLEQGKPFALDGPDAERAILSLREALAGSSSTHNPAGQSASS